MRRTLAIVSVVALLAACGTDAADTTTTAGPLTTSTTEAAVDSATTSDTQAPSTTAQPTPATTTSTTLPPGEPLFTVDRYGHDITAVLTSSGALGSGCAPGTDALPDGLWFGWVSNWNADSIEFDLACLWPGREEAAASNDAAKLRTVPVSADAPLYTLTGNPVPYSEWDGEQAPFDNAPGLPGTPPVWVFVNNGAATELLEHPVPVNWAMSATAWPGLIPGCCDAGEVAPASPDDPWPADGWPADGFYNVYVEGRSRSNIDITMHKWLSCADHPDMCPEWWTDENVTTDFDAEPLERMITFERDLTVVILPIASDMPIVGNGIVLRELMDDVDLAIETWIRNPDTAVSWDEMRELAADPSFPFGLPNELSMEQLPIGFRGPGDAHLTYFDDPAYLLGWTAMEIREGKPILYIHAGMIAG
ncbi:MAG: hypothetical protein U9N56_03770 [Actinomycetota bacterium]|nr:hypothetical protein [Actinomycetota bacterium]